MAGSMIKVGDDFWNIRGPRRAISDYNLEEKQNFSYLELYQMSVFMLEMIIDGHPEMVKVVSAEAQELLHEIKALSFTKSRNALASILNTDDLIVDKIFGYILSKVDSPKHQNQRETGDWKFEQDTLTTEQEQENMETICMVMYREFVTLREHGEGCLCKSGGTGRLEEIKAFLVDGDEDQTKETSADVTVLSKSDEDGLETFTTSLNLD